MKITKTLSIIAELHDKTGIIQFPCYPRGEMVEVKGFRFSTKRAEKRRSKKDKGNWFDTCPGCKKERSMVI